MKRRSMVGVARIVLWSALGAAGSPWGCSSGNDLTGTIGALPACTYAAGLGTLDASVSGACTAARVGLSCDGSNGGGEFCLSDELGQCPASAATIPGVTYSNCTDRCNADEYAISCGLESAGGPSPPSSCRIGVASPGGAIYCCPCN